MILRLFVGVFCASVLAACSSSGGYPENPIGKNSDVSNLTYYFSIEALKEFDSKRTEALRNEIIYGRIAAYDAEFSDFQINVNKERLLTDATADSAVAIMGGVGSAIASNATKTALLAATSAVTGVQGAVDKDIFYNQAMPAIFAYMASNRKAILARIEAGTVKSLEAYPLTQGIADTLEYRDAGSIPGALIAITQQTGPAKKAADDAYAIAEDRKLQILAARHNMLYDPKSRTFTPIKK
jgi:hypothetical protein